MSREGVADNSDLLGQFPSLPCVGEGGFISLSVFLLAPLGSYGTNAWGWDNQGPRDSAPLDNGVVATAKKNKGS